MKEKERHRLYRKWDRLERTLPLLERWDSKRGLLFVSKDASADEDAAFVANSLTKNVLAFDGPSIDEDAWSKRIGPLKTQEVQQLEMLDDDMDRPCVLIVNLDLAAVSIIDSLKGLLENARFPVNCVATAKNLDAIPDYLSSHFFICNRVGED